MSNKATLTLFKAVQIEQKDEHEISWKLLERSISNGIIFDPAIKVTSSLLSEVEDIYGVGGEKLNATFHKSWGKVRNAPLSQLVIEQIVHYITTYGFESLGIYSNDTVYIPAEQLEIPEVTEDIPLIVIRGMTFDEIMEKIVVLGSSGIALSTETLDCIMAIISENLPDSDFIWDIRNRELKVRLYDFYGLAPSDPEEFLRYVIYKLTGETLVIKNAALIAKIKASDGRVLDSVMRLAPGNLSSIFLRYKPLFLAMKSISGNKTFYNNLRRAAVYFHEAKGEDYLNTITAQIESNSLVKKTFSIMLDEYNPWRKIRLANALATRLGMGGSIMYKVRNGKSWVKTFSQKMTDRKVKMYEWALNATLDSIASNITHKVNGRVFYIPEEIHYALPATEKQFTGNLPSNTFVELGGDMIFGVHWFDHDGNWGSRVDIDLALISATAKVGWDAYYRTNNRNVLFSGDMTSAARPQGATELFYIERESEDAYLISANYFNFMDKMPVECQLVVSSERPNKRDFAKDRDARSNGELYVLNPNNIVLRENVTIDKKQNVIGLVVPVDGKTRLYINESGLGNSISSRNDTVMNGAREFLVRSCLNTIELRTVLEMAGAIVVDEIPDYGDYVDLRPENVNRATFIELFSE